MNPATFLLLNLALAFYNVGTIWAHEVDIFRTWKLVDPDAFPRVQAPTGVSSHVESFCPWDLLLPVLLP
jgi:hypothetical protein